MRSMRFLRTTSYFPVRGRFLQSGGGFTPWARWGAVRRAFVQGGTVDFSSASKDFPPAGSRGSIFQFPELCFPCLELGLCRAPEAASWRFRFSTGGIFQSQAEIQALVFPFLELRFGCAGLNFERRATNSFTQVAPSSAMLLRSGISAVFQATTCRAKVAIKRSFSLARKCGTGSLSNWNTSRILRCPVEGE